MNEIQVHQPFLENRKEARSNTRSKSKTVPLLEQEKSHNLFLTYLKKIIRGNLKVLPNMTKWFLAGRGAENIPYDFVYESQALGIFMNLFYSEMLSDNDKTQILRIFSYLVSQYAPQQEAFVQEIFLNQIQQLINSQNSDHIYYSLLIAAQIIQYYPVGQQVKDQLSIMEHLISFLEHDDQKIASLSMYFLSFLISMLDESEYDQIIAFLQDKINKTNAVSAIKGLCCAIDRVGLLQNHLINEQTFQVFYDLLLSSESIDLTVMILHFYSIITINITEPIISLLSNLGFINLFISFYDAPLDELYPEYEKICSILCNLIFSQNSTVDQILTQNGMIERLCQASESLSFDNKMLILEVLSTLIRRNNAQYANIIAQAGGISIFVDMIESIDSCLIKESLDLLLLFASCYSNCSELFQSIDLFSVLNSIESQQETYEQIDLLRSYCG